jgi:hypothetical protein
MDVPVVCTNETCDCSADTAKLADYAICQRFQTRDPLLAQDEQQDLLIECVEFKFFRGKCDVLLKAFGAFRRRHERPQHASQLRQIDWLAGRRTRQGKVEAKKIEVVFIVIMPVSGFDFPCQQPERRSKQMLDVLSEHALDAVAKVPTKLAFGHIGVADTVRLHRQCSPLRLSPLSHGIPICQAYANTDDEAARTVQDVAQRRSLSAHTTLCRT